MTDEAKQDIAVKYTDTADEIIREYSVYDIIFPEESEIENA